MFEIITILYGGLAGWELLMSVRWRAETILVCFCVVCVLLGGVANFYPARFMIFCVFIGFCCCLEFFQVEVRLKGGTGRASIFVLFLLYISKEWR